MSRGGRDLRCWVAASAATPRITAPPPRRGWKPRWLLPTAGAVRIATFFTHPDLFWALKGGGGGTFGMVTRLTLRARALPGRVGLGVAAPTSPTPSPTKR